MLLRCKHKNTIPLGKYYLEVVDYFTDNLSTITTYKCYYCEKCRSLIKVELSESIIDNVKHEDRINNLKESYEDAGFVSERIIKEKYNDLKYGCKMEIES